MLQTATTISSGFMRCPKCGCQEDKVIDSRASREGATIRRRRKCEKCGHRFTTYEEVEHEGLMVLKRDGRREEFLREKLLNGIKKACQKRPIAGARSSSRRSLQERSIAGTGVRPRIASQGGGQYAHSRVQFQL